MAQNAVAASRPNPSDQRPREEILVLHPDSDGKLQCSHCPERYGHRCHEPYKLHLEAKHGYTIGHIHIESIGLKGPEPEIRTCYNVWCEGGTHYVRVNVLRSFEPNSTIQQVDEDKTFTAKRFFQMHFVRTKVYEDTVKRIMEFDGRCCRPVEATTTASTPKHSSLNAGTDSVDSGYNHVVKWLRSCFLACIPTHRRPGRWTFSAQPSGLDLLPVSHHPSTAAIIPNTGHRFSINVTASCKSSDSEDDTEYRMSTKNLPAPTCAASDRILPQAFCPYHSETREPCFHPAEATGAFLPDNTTAIVAVDSFYSTCQGVCGCKVLVITKSDNISLLQRVSFRALTGKKRIARQLRYILGERAFDQVLQFEEKRACIRDPVYIGVLPEEARQMDVGEKLPLEQCSPILQAYVHSISNI